MPNPPSPQDVATARALVEKCSHPFLFTYGDDKTPREGHTYDGDELIAAIALALHAKERETVERCAKVAEEQVQFESNPSRVDTGYQIAAKLRTLAAAASGQGEE